MPDRNTNLRTGRLVSKFYGRLDKNQQLCQLKTKCYQSPKKLSEYVW